ncbi:efflux RND transporter periplasmic adaptor subunit [Spongiivirga sp. MCCC 1A20706]|uniref:efflux RND transporter periplasmic adaptor subunit n=1 Tax=Spongiivirga sp. MCCC 1A20706 TaxID=3160963 RepID=UPI003977AD19
MKQTLLYIVISLVFIACGGSGATGDKDVAAIIENGDLAAMKEMKENLAAEQTALESKIKLLEDEISKKDTTKRLPLVTVFKAKDTVFTHFLELQGSVATKQNVVIYPEMSGTLLQVYAKEGQRVRKGQLLARIDDGGMSQQVAQLQVQAELAKTTFERQKRLWEQNIGSEIQYLQAKTNYEATQNAVKQAKSQLGKSTIEAPFSGVIDEVITEQGTVVAPGQSMIFRLVNLSDMYINADVPETYITSIKKNKKVEVNFPVLGKNVDAKIRQSSNFINPANRTFTVEIAVPNKDGEIKPNLTARLRINDYTNEKAILVPQSIISENANGDQYVYVVENRTGNNEATATQRIITTGKTQAGVIEVLDGLSAGDEIIEEGARSVKDKQGVKIMND